jgi:hypothetical protein
MLRTFGLRTLTGVAQPVIGDVTTAAVPLVTAGQNIIINVANSAIYQMGDRIVIDPYTLSSDEYKVVSIPSGTTISCAGSATGSHVHASGAIITLADACFDVIVLPFAGGAGPVYIGVDNTITLVPAGNIIFRLEKVVAGTNGVAWHMAGGIGANVCNTAEAWMVGTAADVVMTYALVL